MAGRDPYGSIQRWLCAKMKGDASEAERVLAEIRGRDLGPARSDVEEFLRARESLLAQAPDEGIRLEHALLTELLAKLS